MKKPRQTVQLCQMLIMYQLVSAKLNFDTFCDNRYNSALHRAKGPNFDVYVLHQSDPKGAKVVLVSPEKFLSYSLQTYRINTKALRETETEIETDRFIKT
jgi:hypothetical protein